jgi:hypothetical protein
MRVLDVLDRYTFTLVPLSESSMRRKELVYSDLREKDIETVIPKDGEKSEVMILKGEFKGKSGMIM